jgi:hypothetical protein
VSRRAAKCEIADRAHAERAVRVNFARCVGEDDRLHSSQREGRDPIDAAEHRDQRDTEV